MKDNSTFIAVVLDRSGSMSVVRAATIDGFNKFLADQKAVPGEALFTLAQFDDQYELVHDGKNIQDVFPLTEITYVPRGWTALNDAIGRTIVAVGAKLAAMQECDRPSKVVFTIITDGLENKSTEFSQKQISDMIEHQQTKYSWQFVFIGANQDAIASANSYQIPAGNALNCAHNAIGTASAYESMSKGMIRSRSMKTGGDLSKMAFFDKNDKNN